jgi:hypothetical protein
MGNFDIGREEVAAPSGDAAEAWASPFQDGSLAIPEQIWAGDAQNDARPTATDLQEPLPAAAIAGGGSEWAPPQPEPDFETMLALPPTLWTDDETLPAPDPDPVPLREPTASGRPGFSTLTSRVSAVGSRLAGDNPYTRRRAVTAAIATAVVAAMAAVVLAHGHDPGARQLQASETPTTASTIDPAMSPSQPFAATTAPPTTLSAGAPVIGEPTATLATTPAANSVPIPTQMPASHDPVPQPTRPSASGVSTGPAAGIAPEPTTPPATQAPPTTVATDPPAATTPTSARSNRRDTTTTTEVPVTSTTSPSPTTTVVVGHTCLGGDPLTTVPCD